MKHLTYNERKIRLYYTWSWEKVRLKVFKPLTLPLWIIVKSCADYNRTRERLSGIWEDLRIDIEKPVSIVVVSDHWSFIAQIIKVYRHTCVRNVIGRSLNSMERSSIVVKFPYGYGWVWSWIMSWVQDQSLRQRWADDMGYDMQPFGRCLWRYERNYSLMWMSRYSSKK